MNKWLIRLMICFVIGSSFGWFCYHEWIKPRKIASNTNKMIKLIEKEKPIKIYFGKWHKTYLQIIKNENN